MGGGQSQAQEGERSVTVEREGGDVGQFLVSGSYGHVVQLMILF